MKPTKEQIRKFQDEAFSEYGLVLNDMEAEKMLLEVESESEARDRR